MFTDYQKKRLCALKSYTQLHPSVRPFVKLILLAGMEPLKAAAMLDLPNPTRTLESAKIQAVLADYRRDELDTVDDWISRLGAIEGIPAPSSEGQPLGSNPTTESQKPPQSNQQLTDGPKQPVSGQTCEDCGKPAGSTCDGRLLCPPCFSRALGFKPKFDEPPVPDDDRWSADFTALPEWPTDSNPEGRCPACSLVLCSCARPAVPAVPAPAATDVPVDRIFEGVTGESLAFWRHLEHQEADERSRLTALLASREEPRF
jgi:hypothetical protein